MVMLVTNTDTARRAVLETCVSLELKLSKTDANTSYES